MLPARIPKKPKRSTRWRSQAHTGFVRKHACAMCGSMVNIEAAHVRLGSATGIGQKPDDWRVTPLCAPIGGCHQWQHTIGEETFWNLYLERHGQTVEQLIAEFIKASPKRREIEAVMKERENAS